MLGLKEIDVTDTANFATATASELQEEPEHPLSPEDMAYIEWMMEIVFVLFNSKDSASVAENDVMQ